MTSPKISFVTPTYRPDLERCELLVESMERFAADYTHYLIVDHADVQAFRHLRNHRTILIESEEIVDSCFVRLPGRKAYWLSHKALPVRGWIIQQILKLGVARIVPDTVLVMIDSDNALVRKFEAGTIQRGDKFGLLDVDYVGGDVPIWTEVAGSLLGIQGRKLGMRGHVGDMIVWHRQHLLELHQHVEATTGLPWQVAIARKRTFSEYILYGAYIREVVGYDASRHFASTSPLVRQPWDHDLSSASGIHHFVHDLDPGNIAVMISSKLGISAAEIRPAFEAEWHSASLQCVG
jgi:hypothetical protein